VGEKTGKMISGIRKAPACRFSATGKILVRCGGYLFLRKKKFWNAAIASGERIRSLKKWSS
jgi:hypothetical protein